MKTKNIFKSLAFAMLMPTMLLTTACSSDDDLINNDEPTIKESYKIPVSVNVTRQGDATRAEYDGTTKTLSFSSGDQLYVEGKTLDIEGIDTDIEFHATLTWSSGGTFTGDLITNKPYEGTADALFTEAASEIYVYAVLLPNGYEPYGFLSFDSEGILNGLEYSKAVAADLATAITQFSYEYTDEYSGGFNLAPGNAIVNCSYKHSSNVAEGTALYPFLHDETYDETYGGGVKIEYGAGNIVNFAIAVDGSRNKVAWKLTDKNADININLGEKQLEAGKIYNVRNYVTLADAFKNGNRTVIEFGESLTLSATNNSGSFVDVTKSGDLAEMITAASMAKDGNNLVITITATVPVLGEKTGSMTIDTVNNTYSWSNATVGAMIPDLTGITINGKGITPLPTEAQ